MALKDLFPASWRSGRDGASRDGGVRNAGTSMMLVNLNDPEALEILRGGHLSASGASVNETAAMKIAVANRCVSLNSGTVSSFPLDVMRRIDEKRRAPAVGHPLRKVLTVRPNSWQTPSMFKRQVQANLEIHGEFYGFKRKIGKEIREIIPLHTLRMEKTQADDLSIEYRYLRKNGGYTHFAPDDIVNWTGLTLDGVHGVSVIRYGAESLGLSIQAEKAAAKLFKNGYFRSGVFTAPNKLSDEAYTRLQTDLRDVAGVDDADSGGTAILEEGMDWKPVSLTAEDMQFIGIADLSRMDVGMFFGVPPHLYGDTAKSTSWGTGLVEQNIAYHQFTIQPKLITWQDTIKRDLLADEEDIYINFDSNGMLKGTPTQRFAAYAVARQWGWLSVNDIRGYEDLEPVDGGDVYLQPSNMVDATEALKRMLNNEPAPPPSH